MILSRCWLVFVLFQTCIDAAVLQAQSPDQTSKRDIRPAGSQPAGTYHPRVATQLYVWGQDRAARGKTLWDDLDAVLDEVKAAGFTAIEGRLDFFDTPEHTERTRKLLAKHQLALAGVYTKGLFHEKSQAERDIAAILETVARIQTQPPPYLDLNPLPLSENRGKTDDQLATQVKMVNVLGRKLASRGMPLLLHQHDPEMRENAREWRYEVAHVDPNAVGFCLDVHWAYRGGQDPLTLVRLAGRKLKALHLRNSRDGIWTESFGPGDVDHVPIARHLREIGFDGWLVLELGHENGTKITRSLVENARISREYIESVFLNPNGTRAGQ